MLLELMAQETFLLSESWRETGAPYLNNYTPLDYSADFQNWCIAQDQQGIIYVANNEGLLEFDGVSWRKTPAEGIGTLRSVAIGGNGRFYTGTENDFGYFSPDTTGKLQFHSLKPFLEEKYREFDEVVWYRLNVGDKIYFMTFRHLLCWDDTRLKVWQPATSFGVVFAVRNSVYVHQPGFGLTQLVDDSLHLIPSGDILSDKSVYLMLPFEQNSILIGTFSHGFFLFDGKTITPFPTSADTFVRQNKLYSGAALTDGYIALGTQRGGLGIMDGSGNLVQIINHDSGLQDESVWFVCTDRQDGIWLALNSGISRIEMPAPVSYFTKSEGLDGVVEKIVRHNGRLYTATSRGIYILESAGFEKQTGRLRHPHFSSIPDIREHSFALLSTGNVLLAGTTNGIYQISGSRVTKIRGYTKTVFSLVSSRLNPGIAYVASREGIGLLRLKQGHWEHGGWLKNGGPTIYDIVEDTSGVLWAEISPSGVLRIEMSSDRNTGSLFPDVTITHFDTMTGLPPELVTVGLIRNKVLLSSPRQIWYIDSDDTFRPDQSFDDLPAEHQSWGFFAVEDSKGHVFTSMRGNMGHEFIAAGIPDTTGNYKWSMSQFLRMQEISNVNDIYPEDDGVVWFAD